MNEDKGYTIFCSRCGAEMNSNSRYCMKCGNLNYDHKDNEKMKPFLKKQKSTTYQVGAGAFMNNDDQNNNGSLKVGIANNTGSSTLCFFVNYLIYVFSIGILFLFVRQTGVVDFNSLAISFFPTISIIISFIFLYIYSVELLFMKCNKRWWDGLIPIYNLFILAEITFQNKKFGFICLVPIIGEIFILVMLYKLGEHFKYRGLLVVLLPFIFIPIIGFGTHTYKGYSFVESNNDKSSERDYRYKKIALTTICLVILFAIVCLLFANITQVKNTSKKASEYYYVYAGKKMGEKIKSNINSGNIHCERKNYSSENGVYYFYYSDVRDIVYLPFYYMREIISGYVKVVNVDGKSQYFVSLTDGIYGYPETPLEEIGDNVIVEFPNLYIDTDNLNMCNV